MDSNKDLQNLKRVYKSCLLKIEGLYSDATVLPSKDKIIRCMEGVKLEDIKVVIIGQDPFHGQGQANGLAFSVDEGIELPPPLKNIFKEIKSDLNISNSSGNLIKWKNQGVLLLNKVLTVELDKAGSHKEVIGWESFTEELVSIISKVGSNVVFMLWGNDAKSLQPLVDEKRHLVLTATHPSPLSASKGFFGCKHFSKANKYLIENKRSAIDWSV